MAKSQRTKEELTNLLNDECYSYDEPYLFKYRDYSKYGVATLEALLYCMQHQTVDCYYQGSITKLAEIVRKAENRGIVLQTPLEGEKDYIEVNSYYLDHQDIEIAKLVRKYDYPVLKALIPLLEKGFVLDMLAYTPVNYFDSFNLKNFYYESDRINIFINHFYWQFAGVNFTNPKFKCLHFININHLKLINTLNNLEVDPVYWIGLCKNSESTIKYLRAHFNGKLNFYDYIPVLRFCNLPLRNMIVNRITKDPRCTLAQIEEYTSKLYASCQHEPLEDILTTDLDEFTLNLLNTLYFISFLKLYCDVDYSDIPLNITQAELVRLSNSMRLFLLPSASKHHITWLDIIIIFCELIRELGHDTESTKQSLLSAIQTYHYSISIRQVVESLLLNLLRGDDLCFYLNLGLSPVELLEILKEYQQHKTYPRFVGCAYEYLKRYEQ